MANGQQLPGMNVLAVVMAAPADVINLATRHVTETMQIFNMGVTRLSAELAVPPALPTGLPPLPFFFPGMAPAGGGGTPTPPVPQGIQQAAQAAKRKPGFII